MSNPHQRQENKKYAWKNPHPNFHTARAGAKSQTFPPTKTGPKHAAQAYLPAHQTKRERSATSRRFQSHESQVLYIRAVVSLVFKVDFNVT